VFYRKERAVGSDKRFFGLLTKELAGNWDTFKMLVFFRVGENWFPSGVDARRYSVCLVSRPYAHHHQIPFAGVQIAIVGPLGYHNPLEGLQGSLVPFFVEKGSLALKHDEGVVLLGVAVQGVFTTLRVYLRVNPETICLRC